MTRIAPTGEHPVEFMQILGHRPELTEKWVELDSELMFSGALSPRLKHRVQMALATHADCRFCASMVSEPEEYERRESLAVAFAKLCQADPAGVADSHFDALYEEFSVDEVVELCVVIGFKLGGLVLGAIWALQPGDSEMRAGYDAVVDEAEQRWQSTGRDNGAASPWKRALDATSPP